MAAEHLGARSSTAGGGRDPCPASTDSLVCGAAPLNAARPGHRDETPRGLPLDIRPCSAPGPATPSTTFTRLRRHHPRVGGLHPGGEPSLARGVRRVVSGFQATRRPRPRATALTRRLRRRADASCKARARCVVPSCDRRHRPVAWGVGRRLSVPAGGDLVTARTMQGMARVRSGQARPCPWFLAGVSVEAPESSVTSRVRAPGTIHLCPLSRGHSHALGWRGGHGHSAGHPRIVVRPGLLHLPFARGDFLICRSGQVVQDRPSPVVGWVNIPELSTRVGRRPAARPASCGSRVLRRVGSRPEGCSADAGGAGQAACPAASRTVKPSGDRISAASRSSMWMSQSPPSRCPGLAHTGTSPASGSAGPGPVSCTWTRIRPDSGPDPRGHRGPAVPPGVTEGLSSPDHQLLLGPCRRLGRRRCW